jgi:hypothetical protein
MRMLLAGVAVGAAALGGIAWGTPAVNAAPRECAPGQTPSATFQCTPPTANYPGVLGYPCTHQAGVSGTDPCPFCPAELPQTYFEANPPCDPSRSTPVEG